MYKHVLLPVAIEHAATTKAALDAAKFLAGAGGKVTAVTVMEPIPPIVMAEIPEGIAERNREGTREALVKAVGPDVEAVVVTGRAGHEIVEYADAHGCDCIVIASHQPGLEDYFLGSTAARVVRHAHCAVHVVR